MTLTCNAAAHAVLLTGILVLAASSGPARADALETPANLPAPPLYLMAPAHPIAAGHGEYVDVATLEVFSFTFSVAELPDGSVAGHGASFDTDEFRFILFEPSSFMFVDGSLAVAGEITLAVNAPPQLAEGSTIFFFVKDNDPDTDDMAALGLVPAELGPMTIEQIVALIGPPPPDSYSPLVSGDVRFFQD